MLILKKILQIIKLRYILLIIILSSLFTFAYRSDFVMFKVIDKLDSLSNYQFKLRNYRTDFIKLVEQFKIPNFNSNFYNMPIYDIQFNQENFNFFRELFDSIQNTDQTYYKDDYILPEHPNDYNSKSNINFFYNSEEFNAKLKIHGRSEEHYINPKKSYAIRFNKNNLFNNMREIALIILDEADVTSLMSYMLLNKYMNFNIENGFVRLRINGVDQGIYFFEEKIRKEVLEKNNLAGSDIIQPFASWTNQTNETHSHKFTYDISSTNFKNYSQIDNGQLLRYQKIINSQNYSEISHLIDIDKFAAFEAIRMLHADKHVVDGDNLKLIYNNATGLFSPFYRSESVIGSIEDYQNKNTLTYENLSKDVPIFNILNKNNEFRNLRNEYLYKIINDKDDIFEFFNNSYEEFINYLSEDNSNLLSQRDYKYRIYSKINIFENNFDKLLKYINYSKVYNQLIKLNSKDYELKISPDSNVFLKLSEFKLYDTNSNEINKKLIINVYDNISKNNFKFTYEEFKEYLLRKKFILNLDQNLDNQENQQTIKFSFEKDINIQNFDISFKNSVTKKNVNSSNVFKRVITFPKKYSYEHLNEQLSLNNIKLSFNSKNLEINEREISIKAGDYYLNKDVFFPLNYKLILKPGVNIKLGPNVSIIVYGNLLINGNNDNPVKISKFSDRNFGSFLVVGNSKTKVNIDYLQISGGNEDYLNGVYASGMLALHNHDVVNISNSIINSSTSDDGLNIKYINNFDINNNIFNDNFADALDVDVGSGFIRNNLFSVNQLSSNMGDGLDFSGSKSIVYNNKFLNFKDKGISVGENSDIVISNNYFENNRSSITIKDSSSVILNKNNYFSKNKKLIEMYIKKNIFNEPTLCIKKNDIFDENINKIDNFNNLDAASDTKKSFEIIYSDTELKINNENLNKFIDGLSNSSANSIELYC